MRRKFLGAMKTFPKETFSWIFSVKKTPCKNLASEVTINLNTLGFFGL